MAWPPLGGNHKSEKKKSWVFALHMHARIHTHTQIHECKTTLYKALHWDSYTALWNTAYRGFFLIQKMFPLVDLLEIKKEIHSTMKKYFELICYSLFCVGTCCISLPIKMHFYNEHTAAAVNLTNPHTPMTRRLTQTGGSSSYVLPEWRPEVWNSILSCYSFSKDVEELLYYSFHSVSFLCHWHIT